MKTLLLIIFSLLTLNMSSQNLKVELGSTNKRKAYLPKFKPTVIKTPEGFSALLYDAFDYTFARYDDQLNLVFSTKLTHPKLNGFEDWTSSLEFIDNKMIYFIMYRNKETKEMVSHTHIISNEGVLSKTFEESFGGTLLNGNRYVYFSNPISDNPEDKLKMRFNIADEKLKLLKKGEVEFPYLKKNVRIYEKKAMDKEDIIYMPALTGLNTIEKNNLSPNVIFSYDYKNNKVTECRLKAPNNKIIKSSSMVYELNTDKQELTVVGFYSDDEKNVNSGVFYYVFDIKTGAAKQAVTTPLEVGFITKEMINDEILARNFIRKNDNGIYLVAQKEYSFGGQFTGSTKFTYRQKEIIVISFGVEGKMDWAKKIYRDAASEESDDHLHYSLIKKPSSNQVCFVFNDNDKNTENIKEIKALKDIGAANMVEVTINEKGEISRNTLLTKNEMDKTYFSPVQTGNSYNGKELIGVWFANGKYKFGKISLK